MPPPTITTRLRSGPRSPEPSRAALSFLLSRWEDTARTVTGQPRRWPNEPRARCSRGDATAGCAAVHAGDAIVPRRGRAWPSRARAKVYNRNASRFRASTANRTSRDARQVERTIAGRASLGVARMSAQRARRRSKGDGVNILAARLAKTAAAPPPSPWQDRADSWSASFSGRSASERTPPSGGAATRRVARADDGRDAPRQPTTPAAGRSPGGGKRRGSASGGTSRRVDAEDPRGRDRGGGGAPNDDGHARRGGCPRRARRSETRARRSACAFARSSGERRRRARRVDSTLPRELWLRWRTDARGCVTRGSAPSRGRGTRTGRR